MLIKIENDSAVGLPILEDNFRQLHPTEVFPLVLTNDIVIPFGYALYDFSQVPEILWNQKLEEGKPEKDQHGVWRQNWNVVELEGQELVQKFEQRRSSSLLQIDHDVDRIYQRTIGNRATEYLLAESEAKAYADAGYTGVVPVTVQEWADVKKWTPQQAADDVLNAAALWNAAQIAIRKHRLIAKDALRSVVDPAGMDSVLASWSAFVTVVSKQLAD